MIALAMSRSPRRYLAPAALVAFVLAVVLIITSQTGGRSASKTSSTPATVQRRHLHHSVLVRPGDSLSAISARTGVSVGQLEQLNPGLDPNALHPGQRIKLRT
jgi:LysM repeat protein